MCTAPRAPKITKHDPQNYKARLPKLQSTTPKITKHDPKNYKARPPKLHSTAPQNVHFHVSVCTILVFFGHEPHPRKITKQDPQITKHKGLMRTIRCTFLALFVPWVAPSVLPFPHPSVLPFQRVKGRCPKKDKPKQNTSKTAKQERKNEATEGVHQGAWVGTFLAQK